MCEGAHQHLLELRLDHGKTGSSEVATSQSTCLSSRLTGHVVLGLTGPVQFQSCRSRPLSIAVCTRDIFPWSAPRRGPAETEFVPARPQHCGRDEHTTFEGRVARALEFRLCPHIA